MLVEKGAYLILNDGEPVIVHDIAKGNIAPDKATFTRSVTFSTAAAQEKKITQPFVIFSSRVLSACSFYTMHPVIQTNEKGYAFSFAAGDNGKFPVPIKQLVKLLYQHSASDVYFDGLRINNVKVANEFAVPGIFAPRVNALEESDYCIACESQSGYNALFYDEFDRLRTQHEPCISYDGKLTNIKIEDAIMFASLLHHVARNMKEVAKANKKKAGDSDLRFSVWRPVIESLTKTIKAYSEFSCYYNIQFAQVQENLTIDILPPSYVVHATPNPKQEARRRVRFNLNTDDLSITALVGHDSYKMLTAVFGLHRVFGKGSIDVIKQEVA